MFTLQAPGRLHALAFSPDGSTLAALGEPGMVGTWDLASRELTSYEHFREEGASAFFGADGRLVILSDDGNLIAVSLDLKEWVAAGPAGRVRFATPLPDRRHVFGVLAEPLQLGVYALAGFAPVWSMPLAAPIFGVAASADGEAVACSLGDDLIGVFDAETGAQRQSYFCGSRRVPGLAIAPGGRAVACRAGQFLHFHRMPPGGESNHHRLNEHDFLSIAWHPSGGFFATTKGDGAVDFWDAGDGERRQSFDWGLGPLTGIAFDPSGDLAAACAGDGRIVLWDVDR